MGWRNHGLRPVTEFMEYHDNDLHISLLLAAMAWTREDYDPASPVDEVPSYDPWSEPGPVHARRLTDAEFLGGGGSSLVRSETLPCRSAVHDRWRPRSLLFWTIRQTLSCTMLASRSVIAVAMALYVAIAVATSHVPGVEHLPAVASRAAVALLAHLCFTTAKPATKSSDRDSC